MTDRKAAVEGCIVTVEVLLPITDVRAPEVAYLVTELMASGVVAVLAKLTALGIFIVEVLMAPGIVAVLAKLTVLGIVTVEVT